MHCINEVRRVNYAADTCGMLRVTGQVLQLRSPGLDHDRLYIAPAVLQFIECLLHCTLGCGTKDTLQVNHEGLLLLGCHVLQRVTNLVDATKLKLYVPVIVRVINSGDGLGNSSQPIHAGNQDVVSSAVFEIGEHREPEVGTLAVGQVGAGDLLLTL